MSEQALLAGDSPPQKPVHDASDASETHGEAMPSDLLLQGHSSIAIDHQGTRYVLRATRAGKLILTK